ncbi:MAG: hypothetical protein IAF02_25775 [Anaerolineae bacterium]|nr:hypothetical protein [Anaerolineae bacterium]
MLRIAIYIACGIVLIHGLIHLLGFVAYWPLAELAELPYKTTLLGERLQVGATGIRLFSVLWLAAAFGLVIAAVGAVTSQSWWFPLMWASVLLSLLVCVLDWSNAFRGALIGLVMLVPLLLVLGLRIQPQPFAAYSEPTGMVTAVTIPPNLPLPVTRYYQATMPAEVPLIESAIVTARGHLRFAGITFPHRLRFTYEAGQSYQHTIEATIFGLPLLKVNERYLDGKAWLKLPVGIVENEPKVDSAANLGLWGESIWFPSIFITDPRVRWQAVNENTALLIVPFAAGEDTFTVSFDPDTGLITHMEALRFRDAADAEKILWQLDILAWDTYHGVLLPSLSSVTWADEGSPWLVIELDDIVYNVDVRDTIRAKEP